MPSAGRCAQGHDLYCYFLQSVFQITERSGREHLLQASTDEERELWAHAIGAVIRGLDARVSLYESQKVTKVLDDAVNLAEILMSMQDPDAGVQILHSDPPAFRGRLRPPLTYSNRLHRP